MRASDGKAQQLTTQRRCRLGTGRGRERASVPVAGSGGWRSWGQAADRRCRTVMMAEGGRSSSGCGTLWGGNHEY